MVAALTARDRTKHQCIAVVARLHQLMVSLIMRLLQSLYGDLADDDLEAIDHVNFDDISKDFHFSRFVPATATDSLQR